MSLFATRSSQMEVRFLLLLVAIATLLAGCGGGGGGPAPSSAKITGRVLSIVTGGALTPAPSVQAGTTRTTTAADGSFLVSAKPGTSTVSVDTPSFGVFVFDTPPAVSGGTVDAGDLYVGPERVTVTGTVTNPSGAALAGASITFGGRRATTGADGRFTLNEVAYSSASPAGFLGLIGTATRTDYVAAQFGPNGDQPTNGTLDIGTIVLSPQSDPTPPGTPFTIYGFVRPSNRAVGAVASLRDAGGTEVRRFTIGTNAQYAFFVAPGSYTLTVTPTSGGAAGPFPITLASTTDVQRRDVDLP